MVLEDSSIYKLIICIPVYNSDITALVTNLKKQCAGQSIPVQIYALDDGSQNRFKVINRRIVQDEHFRYDELPQNIGRSRIRNTLGLDSHGSHLLFLDSDLQIENPDYLSKYIQTIQSSPDAVIMGGVNYPREMPDDHRRLHWKYGHQVMSRKRSPERSLKEFISFNFVIPKALFDRIHFDESIVGYGHEDTLMGYQLAQEQINVCVIDNPVLHHDIDLSTDYLNKIKRSVHNLKVMSKQPEQGQAVDGVKLVKAANLLRKMGVSKLMGYTLHLMESWMVNNLLGPRPSLFVLNLFKLSLYLNDSDEDRI